MSNPLVSVIIPTLNRAHLIGETLDSILAQTYQNWECIIVDDGSSDNTDELVGKYTNKDKRFKYHYRPKERPKGGNAARNYGFEISRGEYIQWFDSDDWMLQDLLQMKMDVFNRDLSVDFVVCGFESITKDQKTFFNVTEDSSNYLEDYLYDKSYLNSLNILWKKKSIEHYKWDETLLKFQDLDFLFGVLYKNTLFGKGINKRLISLRIHNQTITKNGSSEVNWSRLKVRERMYNLSKTEMSDKMILRLYNLYLFEFRSVLSRRDYKTCIRALKTNAISNMHHKIVIYMFLIIHFCTNFGLKLFLKYIIKISK